jgi:hypothetical protein
MQLKNACSIIYVTQSHVGHSSHFITPSCTDDSTGTLYIRLVPQDVVSICGIAVSGGCGADTATLVGLLTCSAFSDYSEQFVLQSSTASPPPDPDTTSSSTGSL